MLGLLLVVAVIVGLALMIHFGPFVGMLLAMVAIPTIVFVGGIVVAILTRPRLSLEDKEILEKEKARKEELRDAIVRDRAQWIKEKLRDWENISTGRVLNLGSAPKCLVALGGAGRLIRVVEYQDRYTFWVARDQTYAITSVISLDVAYPTRHETIYRTELVPVTTQEKKKRPVVRALVGGVLLGPVGAVAGAASGLNRKETTKVEEHKVRDTRQVRGGPQLIMGISDLERPLLKIEFDPASLAEDWLYRIRAAQARQASFP